MTRTESPVKRGVMGSGSSVTVARQSPSNDSFVVIPASSDLHSRGQVAELARDPALHDVLVGNRLTGVRRTAAERPRAGFTLDARLSVRRDGLALLGAGSVDHGNVIVLSEDEVSCLAR